jgi:rSAM/selenodomain-associated transferase 1
MPQANPTITIFARWPQPGKCKTRLIPALGVEGAAEVYRKLLLRTVGEARASGLQLHMAVTGAPLDRFADWLGTGITFAEQGDGDLGAKMGRIEAPVLLIGSDCPGLNAARLRDAAAQLHTNPAVIGPARDGGYYLLGLARPMPFLFSDMPWSTSQVLPETLRRLDERGLKPAILAVLDDIDTPDDLARFPEFAA